MRPSSPCPLSPLPIGTVNHESHHALGRLTSPPKSRVWSSWRCDRLGSVFLCCSSKGPHWKRRRDVSLQPLSPDVAFSSVPSSREWRLPRHRKVIGPFRGYSGPTPKNRQLYPRRELCKPPAYEVRQRGQIDLRRGEQGSGF